MMSHRILPATLLLCTLAACGENPTGGSPDAHPAGPAYDGGYTMGSGGGAPSNGSTTGTSTTATGDGGSGVEGGSTGAAETTSTTDGSAARGGYTMGSGG